MTLIATILAAAVAGQSVPAPAPVSAPAVSATDVAYAELSTGNADAAVRKLEGTTQSDPAVLINLGAAYARQGATDKALATYRAAIASPERYDLELADGRWMDSRAVARVALAKLQRDTAQALR